VSVRDVIRTRVHKGDTRLLADIRKAAGGAAAAGSYDQAAAFYDLEADATEEAPTIGVDIGQPVEVDVGDGVLLLGTVTAIYPEARNVDVSHYEEFTTGNGYTFPKGYVSTHPIDAITVLLPPEPVADPAPAPSPSLPPVDLSHVFASLPKTAAAGILVKSALAAQESHGGTVTFPDRHTPVTRNTASDARRLQEEKEARRAHA
jgi:hypothetical protein